MSDGDGCVKNWKGGINILFFVTSNLSDYIYLCDWNALTIMIESQFYLKFNWKTNNISRGYSHESMQLKCYIQYKNNTK